MILTGMIFQYNVEQGIGLLMLSDGTQKEFNQKEWTDTANAPAVGQKIAYISNASKIEIRVATQEDISAPLLQKEDTLSVESQLKHFIALGFKLVKESTASDTRTLILRSFANYESEEVVITQKGTKVSVMQSINGKPIER